MLEAIEKLCSLYSVSGCEAQVRSYISSRISPFADSLTVDALGNLIAFRAGKNPGGKRVMLAAHMDEVGMIITHITKDGFIKFAFIGGVDRRVAIGQRVVIGEKSIPGVIALKASHLSKDEKTVPKVSELFIDIGAKDETAAEKLVQPGDCAAFYSETRRLGPGMLKARAIDDRVGCAVLMELVKEAPPVDCWYVFTVQEEIGTRGAVVAANGIMPDIALVVEGATAADFPSVPKSKRICSPGKGVVIPFMDGGTVYDRGLYKLLCDTADANGIMWQTKQYIAGGTDASAIQRSSAGVRTAGIAVAVRNIHSASSVVSIEDCLSMLKLSKLFLEGLVAL